MKELFSFITYYFFFVLSHSKKFTWNLYNGTLRITGTEMYPNHPNFPSSCYYERDEIKKVVIKKGMTSIGGSAFSGCFGLTSITIPNSVTSIGNRAFAGCSALTSITIPNSVTSIGSEAFNGCSRLTSITIPNSVTSIGDYAFSGCSGLTYITIPN